MKSLRAIATAAQLLLAVLSTQAQVTFIPENFPTFKGEPVVNESVTHIKKNTVAIIATARKLYLSAGGMKFTWDYAAPPDDDIEWAGFKPKDPTKMIVLLSSGKIDMYDVGTGEISRFGGGGFASSNSKWEEAGGDAVYMLSYTSFQVSRDSGATWQPDTSGLGSVNYNFFALDSSQYVYLATTGGIFKQHPDSNVWHLVSSFPGSYVTSLFVDRKDRVYASTYGAVYMSSDGGVTWYVNSIGLGGGAVARFGDDAFNNIYALVNGMVVRSDSGTASWVQIDTSISNKIKDPINSYASPYNAVAGDTAVYLATNYGLFVSTDQGATWAEDNDGIQPATLYGFVKSSSRWFISTGLGLYYEDQGDTNWRKTFPSSGYEIGGQIYIDNAGNLYTLGPVINIYNSQSPLANWKSTDDGTTWFPDTAGLGVAANSIIPIYFADENGIQHYSFGGAPAPAYKKSAGSSWIPDTAGLSGIPQCYPNVFASDKRGNFYWGITTTASNYAGLLYRRPIAGGTWVLDTAGLQNAIVYSITPDKSGNLYAGTYGGGIYKKTGSTWSGFSTPNGLGGSSAFVTAMDSSGALWAGFATQNGFNYLWHGIFYTTDNGSSWNYAGLDSISVRALVVYGDTVFAVTYNDGLYALTKSGGTNGVRILPSTPNAFALAQNYPNPFNPATNLQFTIGSTQAVSLKVYDLLGREVSTLVHEKLNPGSYTIPWNASSFASGVYFYRLESGSFVETKKMVLMK